MKVMTRTTVLPFSSDDVVTNLSKFKLSIEEKNLLKNGLAFGIPPARISKSEIFTTFEMINCFATTELKSDEYTGQLKAEISHLANSYYSSYKPTKDVLRKHGILRRLRKWSSNYGQVYL